MKGWMGLKFHGRYVIVLTFLLCMFDNSVCSFEIEGRKFKRKMANLSLFKNNSRLQHLFFVIKPIAIGFNSYFNRQGF